MLVYEEFELGVQLGDTCMTGTLFEFQCLIAFAIMKLFVTKYDKKIIVLTIATRSDSLLQELALAPRDLAHNLQKLII